LVKFAFNNTPLNDHDLPVVPAERVARAFLQRWDPEKAYLVHTGIEHI
jgi:hypothetical protein